MSNIYHKKKKLGRIVRIQFFNNMLVIAYLDKDKKIRDIPNSEDITIGRPRGRFYKVKRSFKNRLKYEVSKRFGKN